MEQSILTVLPNLSIGVVSVLSLVYVTVQFLRHLDERTIRHETAMSEREHALRKVECDVRSLLVELSNKNQSALIENTKALERFFTKT
jgi:hypothetical protein